MDTEPKLVFLDTETTGHDMAKDRLIQLCYSVDGVLHTDYFTPPIPVSFEAMSVHHITTKMLEGKPVFQGSDPYTHLAGVLSDHILVAHHALFDVSMLESEGLQIPRYICTLKVVRHLDEKGILPQYKLQYLRYKLGIEIDGTAHDAEGDVKVLIALFERLIKKLTDRGMTRHEAIEEMLALTKKPVLMQRIPFGKYRDKSFAEIAATDANYFRWLLAQKESEATEDDADLIYTLKYYLESVV